MDIISIWQYIQLGNTWLVDVGWIEIFAVFVHFRNGAVDALWGICRIQKATTQSLNKNIALFATEIKHM